MVSVIIPVYNAEKTVGDAIQSVLNQSYTDFELLLIDDGSSDASLDICKRYAAQDPRIKVFHKPNGGVSSARNMGLDNAKGDFVNFLDNDDCMYPKYLETMVNNIGDYDYLLSSYIEGGGNERSRYLSIKRRASIEGEQSGRNRDEVREKAWEMQLMGWGSMWCTLFRKSIIDKYNIRYQSIQHEDVIFLYEYVLHCESIKHIEYDGIFRFYRDNSQGHSHKYIGEETALTTQDKLFYDVLNHFNIVDNKVIDVPKRRLVLEIRSFLFKGYYKDTRVPARERIARWNRIRSMHFLCKPYNVKLSPIDKLVHTVLRLRLYNFLDPLMLLAANFLK